ncbi:MAG: phytoene dehydrogenase [Polyangiaceae bacterium]
MMQKHYDVVVLGRSIGALSAAALLARRDFNVLVLGQGAPPPSYTALGFRMHRRAFTFLGATSPTWRRMIAELAQSQTWKRRVTVCEPMLQALSNTLRFEIPTDPKLFERETRREFGELLRVVTELYEDLARVNAVADDIFDQEALWPPGTFWERRETNRLAKNLPYIHAEPDADLLSEFPRGHFYRRLVRASVLFATDFSSVPPPFAVARLHGAWSRGLLALGNAESELEEFLVERIHMHGGKCELFARAASVTTKRGAASGVQVEGEEHPTGATFILTDLDGEGIAALAGGQAIHQRALREWPRITSTVGRFVASVIVRTRGLPAPLGPETMIFPPQVEGGPRALAVHVQRFTLDPAHSLLVGEILLRDHGALALGDARAFILRAMLAEMPFLEAHVVAVDSPYDGLPLWDFRGGKRRETDRMELGLPRIEPMRRQLEVDPPGYLGLAGEPIRGPIDGTLLVGRSVLPGLGQEGELLAAWGAARIVTRSDRKRARMRREMWTKVEFG